MKKEPEYKNVDSYCNLDLSADSKAMQKLMSQRSLNREGKSEEIVFSLSNNGFKLYAGIDENIEHGGFEHSGLFALVDKKGVIRSRKDSQGNPILYYRAIEENGFPNQINELKEDIKILLDEY